MKVLKILSFVWSAQAMQLVKGKSILSLLGSVFFLALMILYGIGVGMMFQYSEQLRLTPSNLLFFINTAIVGMTLIKSYFPSYRALINPLPSFFPVSRTERAIVSVTLDIISPYTFAVLVFYGIVFSLGYRDLTTSEMFMSIAIFAVISFADRSLKCLLEYNVPFRWLHLMFVIPNIAIFFLKPNVLAGYPLYITGACMFATLQHSFLALYVILPKTEMTTSVLQKHLSLRSSSPKAVYIAKAFFITRAVRTLLILGLFFQIFPLIFFTALTSEQAQRMQSDFHFNVTLIFIAPIICYTYILNNAFGLNWHLWQTAYLHNGTRKALFLIYIRLTVMVLFIDSIFLFSALWYRHLFTSENIIFWFCSAIILLPSGFFLSIVQPVKVEKFSLNMMMSIRSISSSLSGLCTLALIVMSLVAYSFHYVLSIGIAFIVITSILYITKSYKSLKYKTYHAIHS